MADFHFLISRVLHGYLSGVARELSTTMRVLIETFVTLSIDQIDLLYREYERQVHSIYETVANGNGLNIHVRFQQHIYEQAKWLHGNLSNITSTAQIVRRCIFLMLILMQQYGGFRGAVAAMRRLNEMTRNQQESRDEHGFTPNRLGISQLLGGEHVSYGVMVSFM